MRVLIPRRMVNAKRWDDLVLASPDGWVFALSCWLDMLESVPQWSLEDQSFLIEENGKALAAVPLHRLTISNTLASSGWGFTSPVLAAGLAPVRENRLLAEIYTQICDVARGFGAATYEVGASPLTRRSLEQSRGVNPFALHGMRHVSAATRVVNLRKSEDELWRGLSEDARHSVKRAWSLGYVAERVDWETHADEFVRIHRETYARTGVPSHPDSYVHGIARVVAPAGHAVLFVGRESGGRAVAFHQSLRFGQAAYYHMGNSETKHQRSGVNYLLMWDAILDARRSGCHWMDLGEVATGSEQGKLKSLSVFKSKFGGELHLTHRGAAEYDWLGSRSDSPGPLRQWLRATGEFAELGMGPVLGPRLKRLFLGGLALADRSKSFAIASRRSLRTVTGGDIAFIAPLWGSEEVALARSASAGLELVPAMLEQLRAKSHIGAEYALFATGSGRTALELALTVLARNNPGRRKVLLPSYGCRGTLDPVLNAGLEPVFVDVDANLLPDTTDIMPRIEADVLACLLVNLCGKAMNAREVTRRARARGVFLIEDDCQNTGGQSSMPDPDIRIFSFGLGKNLCATAGGALAVRVYPEDFLAEAERLNAEPEENAAARFAWWARWLTRRSWKLRTESFPEALRTQYCQVAISPLDAGLVRCQLAKLDDIIESRRRNARTLIPALQGFAEAQDPEGHIYTKFSILLADGQLRDRLVTFLANRGVEAEHMYKPLHLRSIPGALCDRRLPFTEQIWRRVVNIPVRPNLRPQDVQHIAEVLRRFGEKVQHGI